MFTYISIAQHIQIGILISMWENKSRNLLTPIEFITTECYLKDDLQHECVKFEFNFNNENFQHVFL